MRWIGAAAAGLAMLTTGPASGARDSWAGAWGYAAAPPPALPAPARAPGTFRYRIRVTQAGNALTIRFSVPAGALPVAIRSATIARTGPEGFAASGDSLPIRFGGVSSAEIAPDSMTTSDPIALAVRAGRDLLITVTTRAPSTDIANNAGFVAQYTPDGGTPILSKSRPPFSLVSVRNPESRCTIVALGDSITEGAISGEPAWRGWPGRLAARLIRRTPQRHCSVVNMGLSGNRLLRIGRGPSAIDRFERDVLAVPGVTHMILLAGINDIQHSREDPVTAADLIAGYRRIIRQAHERGLHIIGGTMTPGLGSRYIGPDLERLRADTNRWILTAGAFDGVIDFDRALSRPDQPALRAEFDSGDRLHPNDAGHAAMANAIPLTLFDP